MELQAYIATGQIIEIGGTASSPYLWLTEIHLPASGSRAMMLLTRSDRSAADQAVHDSTNGAITVEQKSSTQGNAYSAHVAVSLTAMSAHRYLMIAEDVTGIGGAAISRLLAKGIREVIQSGSTAFLYANPNGSIQRNGNPATLKGVYRVELLAHPSLDFQYELNNGELKDIEVIDASITPQNFDGHNATALRSKTIRLKPLQSRVVSAFQVIQGVCTNAVRQRMDQVRIKFADTEGVNHTVVLDPRNLALLNENRFIKRELLTGFRQRLSTGTSTIIPEVRDRILAKL